MINVLKISCVHQLLLSMRRWRASSSSRRIPPLEKGTRGCSFAVEMKNESDKNSVVINMSSEVTKPSQQVIEREEEDVTPTYLLNFAWISALTLSQLLLCMRLCEGIDAVFGLLMDNEVVMNRLSQQDWQWLTVLKAAEVERWKEIMPKQVVNGLLSELNIVSIKDVGPDLSDSKSEFSKRFHLGKQPPSSIIILVDGNCPCCTLPLKGRVSDNDCYVTSFHCGHSYHKVCLREANMSRCIRCEIERQRHRQQQQQQGGTLSSQCSSRRGISSGGIQPSVRHITARTARVNVPSSQAPKTSRKT
uniref:RING-type domain-containing protein n=1 Tax=Parascaris univalens TaxID=6257 RepID=A0A914ZQB9_PARUN